MEFVESPTFSAWVQRALGEDSYSQLQAFLAAHPNAGAMIPGGGGLRKIRWAASGRGKRGGARIVYYWYVQGRQIHLLLAYEKGRKDNLSRAELAVLRKALKD